jgi:hypothetical protein
VPRDPTTVLRRDRAQSETSKIRFRGGSGIGWNATSHQPTGNFRIALKIATIRFKFKFHSGF